MNRSELPIASPCGADWDAMIRDLAPGRSTARGPSRFCGECEKHVHELSALTELEARRLLASPATEGLCVRYLYDDAGNVRFAPEPTDERALVAPSRLARAKRYVAAATALALPMSLTACMGAYQPPPPRALPAAASAGPNEHDPAPTAPAAPTARPAASVAAPDPRR